MRLSQVSQIEVVCAIFTCIKPVVRELACAYAITRIKRKKLLSMTMIFGGPPVVGALFSNRI